MKEQTHTLILSSLSRCVPLCGLVAQWLGIIPAGPLNPAVIAEFEAKTGEALTSLFSADKCTLKPEFTTES